MPKRVVFPFSAIVALDKLKLAIIINAINPKIGGILIRGPKGSGKTTVVRGLTDILPNVKVVKACLFNCNPFDPSNMCPKCSERYEKKGKLPVEEMEMTVVNLPLGATEDRVVGSLDVEKAIKLGVEALEPGILAEANQNILYVDEINLLPDHIADDLLDAAATGWNVVEREGISVSHPSRFIFIGTMNPEEGELRPQLLDRFPLSIGVERISSVKDRIEVVKRNIEFEENPKRFREKYRSTQEELKKRITRARGILPKVEMPEKLLEAICKTCLDLKVDGMRPDIVISKAASALTAFENRKKVTSNDVLVASELALSHRTREGGFLEPATPEEISKTFMARVKEVKYLEETGASKTPEEIKRKKPKGRTMIWAKKEASEKEEEAVEKTRSKLRGRMWAFLSRLSPVFGFGKRLKKGPKDAPVTEGVTKGSDKIRGETFKEPEPEGPVKAIPTVSSALKPVHLTMGLPLLTKIKVSLLAPFKLFFKMKKPLKVVSSSAGKRAETITTLHRGRPRGWRFPQGRPRDIHLPATIRAAARRQKHREKPLGTALKICVEDVREKLRLYKAPMSMVFVIDLSGSMIFSIEEVKEAMLKLHGDAYRYRDKVGIVALKETGAVVFQHPITNLRVVANKLLKLRISGHTPLAAGMLKALEVLKKAKRRDRSAIPVMIVITDGSANVPLKRSLETGEIREFDMIRIALREFEDMAVEDVMSVSRMIRKQGIHTIVVNTNPHMYGRETYGLEVTRHIASVTSGSHHEVGRLAHGEELVERIFEGLLEDQRLIAHDASLASKFNVNPD
jgi:magnesium chelatase subunit D